MFDAQTYWENRLRNNYNLTGVGHISYGTNFNKWVYRVKAKAFFNVILSFNLNAINSKVLDIGSGTGFYIDLWKKVHVKSIAGSDITSIAVNNLSTKYPDCKFYHLDISNKNSLPNCTFDIISAFDILYHIVDDKKFNTAIENIRSILRPHGFFILSDNFLHGETIRTTHHVSRSLKDIVELFDRVGLEILGRRAQLVHMSDPVDASWLRRTLWSFAMLPATKSNTFGNMLGALMYPFELRAIHNREESPTTEIMVCRRKA